MRRFAFNYYLGIGLLLFILYASFLHEVDPRHETVFFVGILAGGIALFLVLIAIYAAWTANGEENKT